MAERVVSTEPAVFPILNLPGEIVDLIISHAIDSPRNHMHSIKRCQAAAANLFTSPLMQVSRLFRNRYLHLVSVQHVWIRLKFRFDTQYGRHDWQQRMMQLANSFPVVSESRLPEFDGTWSTVEIESYPLDDRWEHEHNVMFPFDFASFCRLLHLVGWRVTVFGRPCALSISTANPGLHALELLETTIIPMVLLRIYPGWTLTFNLPQTVMPADCIIDRVTARHRSIREDLGVVVRYIEHADRLEAEGHQAESGLWLLHHTWIYFYLRAKYSFRSEHCYDWNHGDTNPDVYDFEYEARPRLWMERQTLNVIGNEVSDGLDTLQCRSAQFIVYFWEQFGLEWFDDNRDLLPVIWSSAKIFGGHVFELFPLSVEQLARRIFVRRFPAQIIDAYKHIELAREGSRPWSGQLDQLISEFSLLSLDTQPCDRVIMATVVAYTMQPGNAAYAQALHKLEGACGARRVKQELKLRRETVLQVRDGQGKEIWTGPEEILAKFSMGGRQGQRQTPENAMQEHYHKARRRLPKPIDPHELRRMDR